MPSISQIDTQARHIKSITNNSIAMFSLKTLHPGGFRTRVFRSDAMSTAPRRQGFNEI
jgi:hypothetical protein